MNPSAELLFEYLRCVLYEPKAARLDPDAVEDGMRPLAQGILYFGQCVLEGKELAAALAKGDLSVEPPTAANEMAADLKMLHASLRHLTWQTQQVAKGDYRQRVDFMGEFSASFNAMVRQLDARQKALLTEIERGAEKTRALEQSGALMAVIADNIPQAMCVLEEGTQAPLFYNRAAETEKQADPRFVDKLRDVVSQHADALTRGEKVEFRLVSGGVNRYMAVCSYHIMWREAKACVYMVSDISAERRQLKALEWQAYRDALTGLYNRNYGMRVLGEWHTQRHAYVLCFIDLNNLKYVNDTFGHAEGDRYIVSVAKRLADISPQAVVCRVGGDEFMVLLPDADEEEAQGRMRVVIERVAFDGRVAGEDFPYSISFGLEAVAAGDARPPSEVLQLADDRMYQNKKAQKVQRER